MTNEERMDAMKDPDDLRNYLKMKERDCQYNIRWHHKREEQRCRELQAVTLNLDLARGALKEIELRTDNDWTRERAKEGIIKSTLTDIDFEIGQNPSLFRVHTWLKHGEGTRTACGINLVADGTNKVKDMNGDQIPLSRYTGDITCEVCLERVGGSEPCRWLKDETISEE